MATGQYVVMPLNPESAEDVAVASACSTRILALEAIWSALKDRAGFRLGYNPAVATACDNLRELERDQPATLPQFISFCGQCGARYARETAGQAKASAEQCNHLPPAVFGGQVVDLSEVAKATEWSIKETCGSIDFSGWPAGNKTMFGVEQQRRIALGRLTEISRAAMPEAGRDMGDENDSKQRGLRCE